MSIMCLKILFFNVLINLSAPTDFPSLYVQCISMLFIFKKIFKRIIIKFTTLVNSYFICFLCPFQIIFLNGLTILVPFLCSIERTHTYLLNKSITHNKYLFSLLYLLSDSISAKSTFQILSLENE